MNVFDLIFVACFLTAIVCGGWIAWLLIRRRWSLARFHGLRLVTGIGGYFAIVVLVGALSPRRVLPADGILRYDDWCLSGQEATFTDSIGFDTRAAPGKKFLIITLKVGSEARRVRQGAPKGALVYLLDENETRYDVSEHAQSAFEKINGPQPELTTKLDPHSSFLTIRVFEVPRDAKEFWSYVKTGDLYDSEVAGGKVFIVTADDPPSGREHTSCNYQLQLVEAK